ncbi:MAG: 4'-phosphopantetheinyl transferase superfamily protein [Gammaproteobacteria bacterium]|nr:4'-phosphopantetheinyl transferase superfamily protein [Gammaproteobacteria bacterium]
MNILNEHIQWMTCVLDSDKDIHLLSGLDMLSDEEKERAARFRFDKHRERYIRGRAFLRTTVADSLNIDGKDLELQTNEFDKPFIINNPLYFNLSHSSATAVLVISEKMSVGIDLEFVDRKVEVLQLAQTVFTASEVKRLENADEEKAKHLFFQFWTAKEAYLKMLGTGLSLSPKKLELRFENNKPVSCRSKGYPSATLTYIELPDISGICCVAYPMNSSKYGE